MTDAEARQRFDQLIWPHAPTVLRMAQILLGRAGADADDLAQETLIKAFRAIDRLDPTTDARPWLMAILRNARIDRARSDKTHRRDVSLESLPFEPVGDDDGNESVPDVGWEQPQDVLNRFGDGEIIEALQRLPEEIRWTLLLVDVEGLDQREAAEVLDVPVGTIKSRAHRGRAMLREALAPLARERRLT